MGCPSYYFRGFIPGYTHLQPWFFIGFAGVITTLYLGGPLLVSGLQQIKDHSTTYFECFNGTNVVDS